MPKKYPRLAEEGRIREDWEYIEWAARVTSDAEDIREGVTKDRWREHMLDKYRFSGDPGKAADQMRGLWDKGMLGIWEKLPDVGIRAGTSYPFGRPHVWFQDVKTGRFTSYADVAGRMNWFYK